MWLKRHQGDTKLFPYEGVASLCPLLSMRLLPPISSSSPRNTGNESLSQPGVNWWWQRGGTSPVVEAQLNTLRSVATGRTFPLQLNRSARQSEIGDFSGSVVTKVVTSAEKQVADNVFSRRIRRSVCDPMTIQVSSYI